MIPSIDAGCLPDVNVWIALASDRHEHHDSARLWFDAAVAPVCFCRVTQMSFLRLLTNPKVMGDDSLTPAGAIAVYRQLANDERVLFAPEPPNIENTWISLMNARAASGGTWTDDIQPDHAAKKRGNLAATLDPLLEPRLAAGQPGRPRGVGNYEWTPEADGLLIEIG